MLGATDQDQLASGPDQVHSAARPERDGRGVRKATPARTLLRVSHLPENPGQAVDHGDHDGGAHADHILAVGGIADGILGRRYWVTVIVGVFCPVDQL